MTDRHASQHPPDLLHVLSLRHVSYHTPLQCLLSSTKGSLTCLPENPPDVLFGGPGPYFFVALSIALFVPKSLL
jgi:hypothetical protein